jgi:hypothetical protein
MVQFCKFPDVKIVDPSNPNIKFDVFHHRFETLEQGCFRIAEMYRYNNSSKTRFLIEHGGNILLDVRGYQVLI